MSVDRDVDVALLQRAIRLARRGEGYVEPNPMVGCVIARGAKIIGEGWHLRFGGPHAEVEALRACRGDARGATVYVSLEPCCHFGKTPPCTDALIQARVARVVFPFGDPHPSVSGRGMKALKKAGIPTSTGLLVDEATELLAPYLTRIRYRRPYFIAKWAQSLDGKWATPTRQSRWISGEPARQWVHRLRARADAIIVGSGTVLADDPMLDARGVKVRRVAHRIVLDRRLRIPFDCRLVQSAHRIPLWVGTSRERLNSPKARRLQANGVELFPWTNLLEELNRREFTNVLIEGGPSLLSSFLRNRRVDEAYVFVAPIFIGGARAPTVLADSGVLAVADALAPRLVSVRRIGPDTLYRFRFTDPFLLRQKKAATDR
jgi:diaminohydroxyphosphoribosylaminopyrimidine deaminase/5-amino-6-(5-phosphoribosylamino)uracil reductase